MRIPMWRRSTGARRAWWRGAALALLLVALVVGGLPLAGVARAASACTVMTNADNGPGSLRQCLSDVDAGGTIYVVPGPMTIVLSAELTITKNLTIAGPGANLLTISGNNAHRVFNVSSDVTNATIQSLTIADGNAGTGGDGGGIYNDGILTVANATISGNTARSGGGIGNAGSLTASNIILLSNASKQGGGISNIGTLVVTTATLISNTTSGGSDPASVAGGGIVNGGTATLTDVILLSNSTTNKGGGLYNASAGTLTMTNATLISNTATGTSGGGGTAGGGGIYNTAGGTVNLTNTTIIGNTAPNGDGGGISNSGTLTVTGATISSNTAPTGYGGGIASQGPLTVTDATISGNTAVLGVGLMNQTATATLTNVTISGNTSNPRANGLGGNGGGIYNYFSGTLYLTNGTLSGNAVTGTNLFKPAGNLLNDGTATVKNTIVAYSAGGAPCDGGAAITDGGGNLDTGTTCGFNAATSKSSTNPLLGALADNGGPTSTHLPAANSPAVGLGVAANCPPRDQRGAARPQGTNCTSGAVQVGVMPIAIAPATLPGGTAGAAYTSQTLTASGGSAPYTFAVAGGALPGGLALDTTTGVLSGTPTQAGAFEFTVTATDSSTSTGTFHVGMRTYTVTIAQGSQTITFANPGSRTYGTAFAPGATASSGLAVAYTSTTPSICTVSGTTVTTAGVGTCTVTASQPGDASYRAATSVTQSFTVTKAPLTVTTNPATKVYGQANPAFTVGYSGLVNGDDASKLGGTLSFTTTATAASGAGGYDVTPGGLTSGNYAITFAKGTLTVTPAPLTVKADDKTKVYGQANPAFTASYSGFVNGDTAASLGGTLGFDTTATAASGVGGYDVTPKGLTSGNYQITFAKGTLTVTKAPLTVAVTDVGKAYSAANPTFAVTFSGFVNGDTASVVSGTPAFGTAATQYSPVGPYAVTATQGSLSAANYTFGPFIPGTLTIAKAATALTLVRGEVTYGDTQGSVTATLRRTEGDGGPVVGATVAFTRNGVAICGGGGQPACPQTNAQGVATLAGVAFPAGLNGGSYPNVVAAAFAGDANHLAAAARGGPLVVARRILWVKPVDQTVRLRQPNPTSCTLQLTNGSAFVNGDDFGDLNLTNLRCQYGRNPPSTNATEYVGKTYRITAFGVSSSNYDLRYDPGTLTVVP